jgi:hypothetical protein
MIWLSFRDFCFEPKCISTSQRSLLGHPGAAFFRAQFSQQLKINFSHLPVTAFYQVQRRYRHRLDFRTSMGPLPSDQGETG